MAASLEVLVRFLHDRFSVKAICASHVIPRRSPTTRLPPAVS